MKPSLIATNGLPTLPRCSNSKVVIDGISINGVDIITWNGDQKITEFKVMLRPLKAVNLVHQLMASMLEKMGRVA